MITETLVSQNWYKFLCGVLRLTPYADILCQKVEGRFGMFCVIPLMAKFRSLHNFLVLFSVFMTTAYSASPSISIRSLTYGK